MEKALVKIFIGVVLIIAGGDLGKKGMKGLK